MGVEFFFQIRDRLNDFVWRQIIVKNVTYSRRAPIPRQSGYIYESALRVLMFLYENILVFHPEPVGGCLQHFL